MIKQKQNITKLVILIFITGILFIKPLWSAENPNIIKLDTNNLFEALEKVNKLRESIIIRILNNNLNSPLKIIESKFCKQVTRSGKAIEFIRRPVANDTVCFLVKLVGHTVMKHNKGYLQHLITNSSIFNKKGKKIIEFSPLRHFVSSEDFKKEVNIVKYYELPEKIPSGQYVFKYEINDQLKASKQITGEISFNIMSRNPVK